MGIYGRIRRAAHTSVFAGLLRPFARAGIFYAGVTGRRRRRLRYLLCRRYRHRPVLQAIARRYGNLLAEDGDVRFGFSSHESPEQIYVGDLKTIQIYTVSPQPSRALLEKYQLPEEPGCQKLWDILSDENPCELIHVEVEEESVFDLPELLSDAGIYLAGRRAD